MRYPISGANVMGIGLASDAADDGTTGAVPLIHGTATGTLSGRGRVFWLRSMWAHPTASALIVALADCSVGATDVDESTNDLRRFTMVVASFAPIVASNGGGLAVGIAKVDFPPPGIQFTTNCCAYLAGTTGALSGGTGATVGSIGGCGYEE